MGIIDYMDFQDLNQVVLVFCFRSQRIVQHVNARYCRIPAAWVGTLGHRELSGNAGLNSRKSSAVQETPRLCLMATRQYVGYHWLPVATRRYYWLLLVHADTRGYPFILKATLGCLWLPVDTISYSQLPLDTRGYPLRLSATVGRPRLPVDTRSG
jgi:hypothetical protein